MQVVSGGMIPGILVGKWRGVTETKAANKRCIIEPVTAVGS